jgi:hypothetical protein
VDFCFLQSKEASLNSQLVKRLRQEDHEFKASLDNVLRPHLKKILKILEVWLKY